MWRLITFSHRQAIPVLILTGLLTAAAGYLAKNLRLEVSSDQLLPRVSSLKQDYEAALAEFGSDKIAAVYVEDADLFTPGILKRLRELNDRLSDRAQEGLSSVKRVESIFTVNNIQGSDGWLETGPLLENIPSDTAKIEEKRHQATTNPMLVRSVISEDGKATLLTLYLNVDEPAIEEGEPSQKENDVDREVYEGVERILEEFQGDFDDIFQIGSPALQVRMADYIIKDQRFLLPLSGLLIAILIGVSLRSVNASVLPLLNALLSTVWTLGFMAYFGIPLNMLNYVVPALILIVGATEDVHFLAEYKELRGHSKGDSPLAILMTSRKVGLTLILTAITTVFGFAATSITEIQGMQHFGHTAAIGMFFRFMATVFFLPAYLNLTDRFFSSKTKKEGGDHGGWLKQKTDRMAQGIIDNIVSHPGRIILLFTLFAIPGLYYASTVQLNNDLLSFLRQESQTVQHIRTATERLSGSKVVYLTIKGNPGDFKTARKLKQIKAIGDSLKAIEEFDTVISIADYLCLVNQEMFGGDKARYAIPDKDSAIAQYLLFFHRSDIESYVNADYSQANMVIRTHVNNSTRFNGLMEDISRRLESGRYGPQVYTITGKAVLVSSAVDKIAISQIASLGSMAGLLFIITCVLFVSLRCGIYAVVANLFSVIVLFAIMGVLGIPLNVGTCMVAAITIGIGVDDTLHLMVRYNRELKNLKDEKKALHQALRDELLPVLVTSLGLSGGFLMLSFSSFVPVQQFGILSAVVVILAVIVDLILTPALLSTIRLITIWDLLGLGLRNTLRERSSLFQGMSNMQVKKFILLSQLIECKAGEHIIKDGEWGNEMYVVVDGDLEVTKVIEGKKITLNELTMGDAFGEIALMARCQRTADIHSRSDAKLLSIDWESLEKIQRTSPRLATKIYLNLARILGARFARSANQMSK